MRIHTSATEADVRAAGRLARVTFARLDVYGSRTSDRAFDVILTGESSRLPNGGRDGTYRYGADNDHAATWDQWGVFLAGIFTVDIWASCPAYSDFGDFSWQTDGRFNQGWPVDAHGDHSWGNGREPRSQECRRCTAVRRWDTRVPA